MMVEGEWAEANGLKGDRMAVKSEQGAGALSLVQMIDKLSEWSGRVAAGRPHRVTGEGDSRAQYVLVQGVGRYDFKALDR